MKILISFSFNYLAFVLISEFAYIWAINEAHKLHNCEGLLNILLLYIKLHKPFPQRPTIYQQHKQPLYIFMNNFVKIFSNN